MRALACITGVLGGACWIASAFLSGSSGDYTFLGGCALLSVAALLVGFLIAGGSLLWLRVVVGVGCVALAWSVVAAVRAELDTGLVDGVLGGLALLLGVAALARTPRRERPVGAHAR